MSRDRRKYKNENEKIPILFRSPKLQKSFEYYWKSLKTINEDYDEEGIEGSFSALLHIAEMKGYIEL